MGSKKQAKWLNDYTFVVGLIAIVFFCLSLYLVVTVWWPGYQSTGHLIYSWPDAMANQTFIKAFSENSSFTIGLENNPGEVIHPRSVNVFNGNLVPMSFLGMLILYGLAGKVIGVGGVLFLTPFIGALSLLFFYGLVKRIFKKQIALISTILLATLAPWIYYSTLVMLHTVLFIGLLIIGLWFLTHHGKGKYKWLDTQYLFVAIGAFIIGLALTVRTVEAPWVLLVCLVILIMYGKKQWWQRLIVFLIFCFIAFLPILYLNSQIYGEALTVGYLRMQDTGIQLADRLPTEFAISTNNTILAVMKAVFLPFGFHPRNVLTFFNQFFIGYYWPYLSLAIIAVLVWWRKKKYTRAQKTYLLATLLSCAWLVFYYGNWLFADWDVLTYNTIGSSYMRYWLPAFILLIPGAAYAIYQLKTLPVRKWLSYSLMVIIVVNLMVYSINWAYYTPRDGLFALRDTLNEYYQRYEKVKTMVPSDSLLVVDKTDKIFFPKYDVAVFLGDKSVFERLNTIIDQRPIYYISRWGEQDIRKLEENLQQFNIALENSRQVDLDYKLYEVGKQNQE